MSLIIAIMQRLTEADVTKTDLQDKVDEYSDNHHTIVRDRIKKMTISWCGMLADLQKQLLVWNDQMQPRAIHGTGRKMKDLVV